MNYLINFNRLIKHGIGGPVNIEEAIRLYHLCAEKGSYNHKYNCAILYDTGNIVNKNPIEAFTWYKRSLIGDPDTTPTLKHIKQLMTDEILLNLLISEESSQRRIKELELLNTYLTDVNETLQTELDYRPNGIGYHHAKIHFDDVKDKL